MGAPPGVPHNKPSREEKRAIQAYVYELLSKRAMHAGQIKDVVAEKFNKSKRSVEPYISRARAKMREESGKDKEDLRSESYHFYCQIANSDAASDKDRLRARERIDKLLGLDTPISGTATSVNFNVTPDQLKNMTDDEFEQYQRDLARLS